MSDGTKERISVKPDGDGFVVIIDILKDDPSIGPKIVARWPTEKEAKDAAVLIKLLAFAYAVEREQDMTEKIAIEIATSI